MGGHSHWAGIKHKKAITDAKRGKVWTKIIKEIAIAAKAGGGNPDDNPRLRSAIADAKASNMPLDNVKRAIRRGTGQEPGVTYEEIIYEGYGPGGIAIIINVTTDSKNRAASEIRKILDQHGGNMGSTGSVGWMFEQKGYISVKKEDAKEDELMNLALEIGAEDFRSPEGSEEYEIITAPADFEAVKAKLTEKKIPLSSSEITMLPKNEVNVGEDKAEQVVKLMDSLEDHDDVQQVYSNFNIPDAILAKLEK
ncbi:MAG: transcriptional regulator [Elusimicrobia bacterium GWA2_64_40]|nr:MAG: transcriptional regulator [Elusimicrobia bacterium GWA2_64_40]OGR67396.1 MAG: transcriptional regulator [Elusimicrobia bacterium GWB2_63_16]HAN05297.1 YebC/PmpR family DNA-binding transcriptional regulator [Elusimicrobiota bacterium]